MAQASEMKWGRYQSYEGPFYKGKHRYELPDPPSDNDKIMAVITATEGGRYDAYNGYDRCISTSGLIQWCEAGQYSVSDMLGKVAEKARELIAPVDVLAESSNLSFKKNARGRWRFFFLDERGEVNRRNEQRQMFLLNSAGKRGTWDDTSREYSKKWAAAISTVWESETAQSIQKEYTARRLFGFAMPAARRVLDQAPSTPVGRAFVAAYLSFAANNPTWANKHLQKALNDLGSPWSIDWFIGVLKELTFGPKVTIYPHRYKAIRPVLEKLYWIDLPDMVEELRKWEGDQPHRFFYDTKEIQEALITLGFDLGPWGADGSYGKKTTEAVLVFEQMNYNEPQEYKVPKEHVDGMMDQFTARKMEWVLEQHGIQILTQ